MHKLEIVGDARILNEGTELLTELDCIMKGSKGLQIVPVKVDGKEGLVLVGNHQLAVSWGSPLSPVEASLWVGPNGTFAKHSKFAGRFSPETRAQVVNTLRRYRLLCQDTSLPYRRNVVLGFSRNGKRKLILRVSSYP
ncbi:MAG: hypothetical protein ACE5OZ_05600 [Candidatus Heimdallarchaeota archaeon]